jgi:hypothetical protein
MSRGISVALAGALLLVAAGSAVAEKRAVSTTVTVSRQSGDTLVIGDLHSSHGFCVRDRPVALKRRLGDGATVEGRGRSDGEGRFEIEGAFVPSSQYFVSTPARAVVVGGKARQCEAARSARFSLG